MRTLFLLMFVLAAQLLFADAASEKALDSKMRAEVYAQELIDAGEYKRANDFLARAIERYPDSDTLLMFNGTSHFYLKQLEEAKKYFRLVLQIDPRNEQASAFIATIEEQEAAQENEIIGSLVEYLGDKGFDFLMIFLAFLGGEIIARRYNECNAAEIEGLIDAYKHRSALVRSWRARAVFTVGRCCFSRNVFTFCFLLDIVVTVIIAVTLLILWLLPEFLFGITLFLDESVTTISSDSLWWHIVKVFVVMIILTLAIRLWGVVRNFESREERYAVAVAEHIETLFFENAYGRFYDALEALSPQELQSVLPYVYSADIRSVITQRCENASQV